MNISRLSARKVALMSDIHSNYLAFKTCFEDALMCGADSFVFLGDYVSDLSEPNKTMELVYDIRSNFHTVCLRGNRERYMMDCDNGNVNFSRGSKSGSLLYTYEHLIKNDIEFFKRLNISEIIEINGVVIEIAHSTAKNDRYYFDNKDGHIADVLPQMKCKYLLTGHSHIQYIHKEDSKTIINPGSVGLPHFGTNFAKYALLDISDGELSCILREVPYDIEKVIHSQFSSSLVDYAKYWAIGILYDIITGKECVMDLLKYVEKTGGQCNEEVWHKAACNLGMKLNEREIINDLHNKRSSINPN